MTYKKIRKSVLFISGIALLLLTNSCSLFKLSIESEIKPLDTDKMKTRLYTQYYAQSFFYEIMQASDSIIENEKDKQIQINALVWKINASSEVKAKVFQHNPDVALLDTWILTATMRDFLVDGKGSNLFGNSQFIAKETSEKLLNHIDTVALVSFKQDYEIAKHFVDSIRQVAAFKSLDFHRETMYNQWYQYLNIPDSLVDVNMGSLPQVLSSFSSQLAIGTDQTLKQTQWNGELLLKQSNIDSLDIKGISREFNQSIDKLIGSLKKGGDAMQDNLGLLRQDFNRFNNNLDRIMDTMLVFARGELAIMRDSLGIQREAIMEDLDKTSNKIVKTALEELRSLVNDILFYVVLILVVILFVPFALGYITGRAIGERKAKKNTKSDE